MCVGIMILLGLQADIDRPATIGLLIALGCFGLLAGLRAAHWWQRMNLAASKALGIDVSWNRATLLLGNPKNTSTGAKETD